VRIPGRSFGWLRSGLLAQTEAGNQGTVGIDVLALQVVQQLAALADQAQQTTTGVVILLVLLEVRGQIVDAGGQQRNLDFRGTGVALGALKFGDDAGLDSVVIAISNSLSLVTTPPQFDRASASSGRSFPLATESVRIIPDQGASCTSFFGHRRPSRPLRRRRSACHRHRRGSFRPARRKIDRVAVAEALSRLAFEERRRQGCSKASTGCRQAVRPASSRDSRCASVTAAPRSRSPTTGPAQACQVRATAQRLPDVGGQHADVGALAAGDAQGQAIAGKAQAVDGMDGRPPAVRARLRFPGAPVHTMAGHGA
jgi:hypothetical protein